MNTKNSIAASVITFCCMLALVTACQIRPNTDTDKDEAPPFVNYPDKTAVSQDRKKSILEMEHQAASQLGYRETVSFELFGMTKSELIELARKLNKDGSARGAEFAEDRLVLSQGHHGSQYYQLTFDADKVNSVQYHCPQIYNGPHVGEVMHSKKDALIDCITEKDFQIHSDYYAQSPQSIAHFYWIAGKARCQLDQWDKAAEDFQMSSKLSQEFEQTTKKYPNWLAAAKAKAYKLPALPQP